VLHRPLETTRLIVMWEFLTPWLVGTALREDDRGLGDTRGVGPAIIRGAVGRENEVLTIQA